MDLSVDRTANLPVYRQIARQIASQSRQGILRPGTRLPGERELSLELGVARGTLQKAFAQLLRDGVVECVQGSGTFIAAAAGPTGPAVRRRRPAAGDPIARIAGIDCNPEALAVFARQFDDLSDVAFEPRLLDEPSLVDGREEAFAGFDLILTTTTHVSDVRRRLPSLTDRILPVAVAPSQRTVVELARIPPEARIGIVCRSQRFRGIIERGLAGIDVAGARIDFLDEAALAGEDAKERLRAFLADRTHLVVPPDGPLSGPSADYRFEGPLSDFHSRGGRTVRYDYRIETGSLVYIGEAVARLVRATDAAGPRPRKGERG